MLIRAVMGDNLYVAQGVKSLPQSSRFVKFCPGMDYCPFCDDFGPMNLSTIVDFIELLEKQILHSPGARIVYMVDQGKRALSNAVFLLGAYLIVKSHMKAQEVSDCFDWLDESLIEHFRDATYCPSEFGLSLDDCWKAIEKGKSKGWFDATADGENWGMVNIDEYRHYDSPCNGDFHMVVPGKFIAFKGPKDLGDAFYEDEGVGRRTFSPAAYADIFADEFKVAAVVRLNEAQYGAATFEARGISHYHLEFDDCTCPTDRIVAAFLDVSEAAIAAGGSVAVHCRAGLGRTGTLIALYLMRSEGFTAREAMGWLRVMRPGSVIGRQQQFLCSQESRPSVTGIGAGLHLAPHAAATDPTSEAELGGGASGGSGEGARRMAEEVAAGAERRAAARAGGGSGSRHGESP